MLISNFFYEWRNVRASKSNFIEYASFPNHIQLFTNSCKGCKPMYNLSLDKKWETYTSKSKCRKKGFNYSHAAWNKIFEPPFKFTQESKLDWLQFQILHRIVPTNISSFQHKKESSLIPVFAIFVIEMNRVLIFYFMNAR